MLRLRCPSGNPDFGRSSRPGESQSHHPLAAGPLERRCASGQGRPGRVDVIHQERPSWDRPSGAHPRRIGEPSSALAAYLARTVSAAETGGVWKAAERGQSEGDLLGGIKSPPAPAPRGRRHGHHRASQLLVRAGIKDRPSRHPRQSQAAAELEAVGELASDPLEPRRGHRQRDPGRAGLDDRPRGRELAAAAPANNLARLAARPAAPTARRRQSRHQLSSEGGTHGATVDLRDSPVTRKPCLSSNGSLLRERPRIYSSNAWTRSRRTFAVNGFGR